jgi:predicted Na+-dependent transporter
MSISIAQTKMRRPHPINRLCCCHLILLKYFFRWSSLFNADLALSVAMTAISTVLSVVTLPANLLLYAKLSYDADVTSNLDWRSVFIALAIVISAIASGLICSYYVQSHGFNILANQVGNISGLLLVIFSATVTNTGNSDSKIWSRDWTFYVATMSPCLIGLILSSLLGSVFNLRKPERM